MEVKPLIYRVVLGCSGVPPHLGQEGAIDIMREFKNRSCHQNVRCEWDGSTLLLQADNDDDEDGKALMDEFSESISAYMEPFDGDIEVRSISVLSDSAK